MASSRSLGQSQEVVRPCTWTVAQGARPRTYTPRPRALSAGKAHAAPDPDRLVFSDVVIDFAGRRLLRGGAEQALEPKAFAVLALLASSPGRAATVTQMPSGPTGM